MQGAAGMALNEPEFVRAVADACARNDVLLVCDEVATGFGRTGTLFAVEQCGVRPDILCLGKGLTGGYLPMSATVGRPARVRRLPRPRPVRAHAVPRPLVQRERARPPRSPSATSSCIDEWDVLANVRARAEQLGALLEARIAPLPAVGEIRRRGLMTGIELAPPADGSAVGTAGVRGVRAPRAC